MHWCNMVGSIHTFKSLLECSYLSLKCLCLVGLKPRCHYTVIVNYILVVIFLCILLWFLVDDFDLALLQVIYDKLSGRSRGFGFVTMSTVEEVEAAVQQFNGYVSVCLYIGECYALVPLLLDKLTDDISTFSKYRRRTTILIV